MSGALRQFTARQQDDGFSPTDIAGLELWLDADDAAGFTYSSGTLVSQWDDLSGNARHVSQSTASLQPDRSSVYGARTAVGFDDNYLRTASSTVLVQPYTLFMVSAILGGTRTLARLACDRDTRLGTQHVQGELESNYSGYAGTTFVTSGTEPPLGELQQGTTVINGASSVARSNGVAGTTVDPGGDSLALISVGARGGSGDLLPFRGDIAELLVYGSAISGTNLTDIETYLKNKWGTP